MRKAPQPAKPEPEPEKFERWTAQRKAAIILEVFKGQISVPEACRKYGFTINAMTAGIASKCFATFLGLSLTCCGVADSAGASTPQTDESLILRYLQSALDEGTSVRLSYSTSCNATSDFPPIPPVRLSARSKRLTGVDAARAIFYSDHDVVITKGPGDVVKISVGRVPTDLLETRVALLKLQPIEQYNPGKVIDALESTKELKSVIKLLDLLLVRPLHIQLLHLPVPGDAAPHVPVVLQDVTIDQALDLVAETFGGVVTFGVCTAGPAPRLLLINYIPPTQ